MYLQWTSCILCLASERQSKPCIIFQRNFPLPNPFILEAYNRTSKWRHLTHSLCTRPCNTQTSGESCRLVKYRPYHWRRRRQCLNNFQTWRHLTMPSGERRNRNTPVRHQKIWVIAVRPNLYSSLFDQLFRKEITPRTKPQHEPINGIRFSLRPVSRRISCYSITLVTDRADCNKDLIWSCNSVHKFQHVLPSALLNIIYFLIYLWDDVDWIHLAWDRRQIVVP
jgi:hypothetical protein